MDKNGILLVEMLKYIRRPRIDVGERPTWYAILFNVIRLWGLSFFLSIFVAGIAQFLLRRSGYSGEEFALTEFVEELPIFLVILFVAVWAPISEELAFRLGLRFSPLNWGIGGAFLCFFILSFFDIPFLPEGFFSFGSWGGIFSIILFLVFFAVLIFFFLKINRIQRFLKRIHTKFFTIIFYFFTLSFAIMHFTNYDVNFKEIWYFAPLLIVPQLFLSFTISFVRMRYGFSWAIFAHFLNNFMALIPVLLITPFGNVDISHMQAEEVMQIFSLGEIFSLFLGFLFLLIIFLICVASIASLIFDFTKLRK
jgi:hypothetical protein